MSRSLSNYDEWAVFIHCVLDIFQNLGAGIIVSCFHCFLVHCSQLWVHFSSPSGSLSYSTAWKEFQLYVRIAVIYAPVHNSKAKSSVSVSVAVACCPCFCCDIYINTDLG